MIKRSALIALTLAVAGCSTVSEKVTGYFQGEDNVDPPAPLQQFDARMEVATLWTAQAGKGARKLAVRLLPVVQGGKLFAADAKGTASAHDAASGALLWETKTRSPISGGPGVGEGLVLLGTSEAEVIALDQSSGEQRWKTRVSSEVLAPPQAADGVVVARTVDGNLVGIDAQKGRRLWVYGHSVPVLTLRGTSSAVLHQGMAVAGFASGKLVALRLKDGGLLWETRVAIPRGRSDLDRMVDIDADPIIADGVIHVASYQGSISTVALQDGRALWNRTMSSHAGLGMDQRLLYVTDADSHVWALDRRSGAALWKQEALHARGLTAPAAVDGYVVVGDSEGYVHWLDRSDGSFVARVRVGKEAITAPPLVRGDMIYVLDADGRVTALRPAG